MASWQETALFYGLMYGTPTLYFVYMGAWYMYHKYKMKHSLASRMRRLQQAYQE